MTESHEKSREIQTTCPLHMVECETIDDELRLFKSPVQEGARQTLLGSTPSRITKLLPTINDL